MGTPNPLQLRPCRAGLLAVLAFALPLSVSNADGTAATQAPATPPATTSPMAVPAPQNPIRLWAEAAPGALGTADRDIPTLTPFLPDPALATGAAIVICPGGGYGGLADHEGRGYAEWLA